MLNQLIDQAQQLKARVSFPSFDSCEEIAWRVTRERLPQASNEQLAPIADRVLEAIR